MKEIGKDFQGWPIMALTLKEVLGELGATLDECGRIGFEDDNPILDKYPYTLKDDGMGYGIDPQFITSAEELADKVQLFIEKENDRKD